MKTGIYMIRNKVNNKAYIGQAVNINKRWGDHKSELNGNRHCNPHLQNAWNKYGADNFEFTVICLCEEDELDDFEIDMIAHYHTFYKDDGYNLTLGGGGSRGYKWTDEQLAYRQSDEYRKILSEAMNRPEVKKRQSEALKGKPKPEEWKAKVSKKVYCVTNDTIYASVVEAGEKLNVPGGGGTVSWCCQGKYTSGNGHIYKKLGLEFWYLDEWESLTEDKKLSCKKIKYGRNSVYCVTNDTVYASTVEAEEKLNIPGGYRTVSYACKGKYRWGNGHVYKKLGLEFWYLSEYEEKFGKVAM